MVGEGVLMECLQNNDITEVLSVSRKTCHIQHPKLKELLVPDFTQLQNFEDEIKGYEACFYCAGISSVGMAEDKYRYITYDTTIAFARALLKANPEISFCFITGRGTDSTEKGKQMWARVKGKTENDLQQMPFKYQYNFRPGAMLPFPEQKKVNKLYIFIAKLIRFFSPASVLTLSELGRAMMAAVKSGYKKNILEVKDIKALV